MSEQPIPSTTIDLSEDRSSARITVGSETFVLDARELENLIGHLGIARSEMRPEVPNYSPQDGNFMQISGPVMEIVESDDRAVVRMSFRTPGYGWIGFHFKHAQVVEVGRHLLTTFGTSTDGTSSGS
jgi:hypothetical protein